MIKSVVYGCTVVVRFSLVWLRDGTVLCGGVMYGAVLFRAVKYGDVAVRYGAVGCCYVVVRSREVLFREVAVV